MIKAKIQSDGSIIVNIDTVDKVVIWRLATAYSISYEDALVSCINKGIEVISRQVQHANKQNKDNRDCDDVC